MMKLWFVEHGDVEQVKSLKRLRYLMRTKHSPMAAVFVLATCEIQAAQVANNYDEGSKQLTVIEWMGFERIPTPFKTRREAAMTPHPPLCIYHANCDDGFGASLACSRLGWVCASMR